MVTRDGRPVAMLTPLPRPRLDSDALLQRWRHVPYVDAGALRRDLDALLDADA